MSPNIDKVLKQTHRHGIEKMKESHDLKMQSLIEAEERERKRFASDLHDGLGQVLTAAKYCLEGLSKAITPQYEDEYKICCELLGSAIAETRNIAHGLMPVALTDYGLNIAISELCKHALLINGHPVGFEYNEKENIKLEDFEELMLFRIVQESINNIQKHAGATRALVSLHEENGKVVLMVSDNGLGFDIKETRQGFGLLSISNRSELLGGNCNIQSEPGKGTHIKVSFAQNQIVN